jgi:diguanylate cyclase (GGDEF)-like protein
MEITFYRLAFLLTFFLVGEALATENFAQAYAAPDAVIAAYPNLTPKTLNDEFTLSKAYINNSDYPRAMQHLDKLIERLNTQEFRLNGAQLQQAIDKSRILKLECLTDTMKLAEANVLAKQIQTEQLPPYWQTLYILNRASYFLYQEQREQALQLTFKAYQQLLVTPDDYLMNWALNNLTNMTANLYFSEKRLNLLEDKNWLIDRLSAMQSHAIVLFRNGRFQDAVNLYLQVVNTLNSHPQYKSQLAITYYRLLEAAISAGDKEQLAKLVEKSQQISFADTRPGTEELLNIWQGLSMVELGQFSAARDLYAKTKQSLEQDKKLSYRALIDKDFLKLAALSHYHQGNPQAASEFFLAYINKQTGYSKLSGVVNISAILTSLISENAELSTAKSRLLEQELNQEKQIKLFMVFAIITLLSMLLLVRYFMRKYRMLASHDSLTGIYNRRYFTDNLARKLKQGENFSLITFDIDNFKHFNDSFGHEVGDEVLKQVVALSSRQIRSQDTFARIGGEEFAILLPEDKSVAMQCSQRIQQELNAEVFKVRGEDENFFITCSFGIAQYADAGDLIYQKADEALYCAKESGKNTIKQYSQ